MGDQLLGGRYRLLRQLGEGGMGEVWQARDERLGRLVAVKVIALLAGGGSRGDEARARFLREARITAALQHPNVVTVHDLGQADAEGGGAPFLVMELLRGEALDAVARRGPVPLSDAARWGAQICDALADAHEAGVLHRDIKPSNVLITESGAVKVLDFGIARAADPYATANRLTQTGFIVGTPPYMAPEQARGHPEARSDLYAVGCLLFELITGRLPFQAPDAVGYLTAHLTRDPPAPSSVAADIPHDWDELVLTLLHKTPDRRYASAADVATALRRLGTGPRQTRPEGAPSVIADHRRHGTGSHHSESPGSQEERKPAEAPATAGKASASPEVFSNPRSAEGRLLGFVRRVVIAAVILCACAVIAHIAKPEESWAVEDVDVVVFGFVLALCVYLTWIDREKDRLSISARELVVSPGGPFRTWEPIAVPWSSLERVGLTGQGRATVVVVWFRPGRRPAAKANQRRHIKRLPGQDGYVLYRLAHDPASDGPDSRREKMRAVLAKCADAKGVELVASQEGQ
ncbi:serine/threonine-protein kinase [Streptomyces sp. NPDC046925]|uniref:serine/threonine-protein kinase n=1 Tax=Streptomyces sp. NPDC046925 TaxID=3155375 RepID=UPI0033D836D7